MLTRINKHRDEAGFTLIELLVVVIIIGILAAIAIPVFLNQRESAQLASVQSDLRNAAIEAETYYTQNPSTGYPEAKTDMPNLQESPGNVITYTKVSNQAFTLCAINEAAGKGYTYDSADGGLDTTSTVTTCGTTPDPDAGA